MRVLGVDPGLRITGYGCLDCTDDNTTILEAGVFNLSKLAQSDRSGTETVSARLMELDQDFRELLDRVEPDLVAVESLFAHYKHPTTAIVMGHARGVLLLAIKKAGVELIELKPNTVKKSVTGHGHASKEQMQHAVQDIFHLPELPEPPDVADALGIALCAARRIALEKSI